MTPPNRSTVTLLSVLERLLSTDAEALGDAERETIEQWITHARRREGAVELAASVAHDLNNLLTSALGAAELLRRRARDDDDHWEIDTIVQSVVRARTLCRQLVTVSRAAARPRHEVAMAEVVDRTSGVLRYLLGDRCLLRVSHLAFATVFADPTELEQVVVNLALNARDAMPEGGVIDLRTDVVEDGACVLLSVTDSGLGMPEEVRARAFEPHFTTKPYGSGLGLHSCLRIVTQLSGRMELESELGVGTTVRVYLPVHPAH